VEVSSAARVVEAEGRETVAREIERVVLVSIGRGQMRMSVCPRLFEDEAAGGSGHASDLEPSEYNVNFRLIPDEAEPAANLPGSSKASEEKKKIAAAYLLVC
jgi:hypothetical protein